LRYTHTLRRFIMQCNLTLKIPVLVLGLLMPMLSMAGAMSGATWVAIGV